MGWVHRLFPNRINKAVEEAAREVATQSQQIVHERLTDGVKLMSLSEARGYVRAKASRPVRQATLQFVNETPLLSADILERIARVATEKVVHCIVRDLLSQPAAAQRVRKVA